jgi:hypothetical protein
MRGIWFDEKRFLAIHNLSFSYAHKISSSFLMERRNYPKNFLSIKHFDTISFTQNGIFPIHKEISTSKEKISFI